MSYSDYGELSKVKEEIFKLIDAEEQGNKILIGCKLSDIFEAYEDYLKKSMCGRTIIDMVKRTSRLNVDKEFTGKILLEYYEELEINDTNHLDNCYLFAFALNKVSKRYGYSLDNLKHFPIKQKPKF